MGCYNCGALPLIPEECLSRAKKKDVLPLRVVSADWYSSTLEFFLFHGATAGSEPKLSEQQGGKAEEEEDEEEDRKKG